MRTVIKVTFVLAMTSLCCCSRGGNSHDDSVSYERSIIAADAVSLVSKPAGGCGNMSPFELQVYYRLRTLTHYTKYKYDDSHAQEWKNLMMNEQANMYGRICAAYFLLDHDEEARDFVKRLLSSDNLRYRYNAAKALDMYVKGDPAKTWAVDLLIEHLANGSLDGSGVISTPPGEFPDGDVNDIMETPVGDICWHLGFMKEKKAVPALISVLKRRPRTGGAAFALGEIGDKKAIPALMKVLKDNSGYEYREVTALGKLKCKEAVPILVSRLGNPKFSSDKILEALLEIGDEQAIMPIEKYLEGDHSRHSRAVAKRVLVQLKDRDPVGGLLSLFRNETYEPEKSDIIFALAKYKKDERVVNELSKIARESDSAFMRRDAIFAMRNMATRNALFQLSSLLDIQFSADLKAEWGWKFPPDFSEYFPSFVLDCLKQSTGQDFPADRKKWDKWIKENVKE